MSHQAVLPGRFGCLVALSAMAAGGATAEAAGRVYEIAYAPDARPEGLKLAVTYRVWIPETAARLRGVIVHQHGCGFEANAAGATAADDLHWQALAAKWDCA